MLEKLIEWDEQLFLYLNAYGSSWLDPVMYTLTGSAIWIPLYLFLLYLSFRHFGKDTFWVLIGIGIAILFADQGTSGIMKPYFGRLRPCHDVRWDNLISNYRHCGGMFGFASSHAANGFAVATFFNITFYKRIRGIGWLFLWATIFAYTRVYLGVHYPGDILIGGLVGIISAVLAYYIAQFLKQKFARRFNSHTP